MNSQAVFSLLEEHTGLDAASLGPSALPAAVANRARARGAADVAAYAALAARDPAELQTLAEDLSVPETWFFRGGELFAYLARHVRELARRAAPVRVLSVPCSSGEEPYSLAIALREAGVPPAACAIDGIDLSARLVEAARRGRYTEFSFRSTEPALRARYFHPVDGKWELETGLRSAVRFATGNVVDPAFLVGVRPYDLVFCRNLFIYLSAAARRKALDNLYRLLAPDGLLCVGHAEPTDPADGRFRPEGPAEYFLYRRQPVSLQVVVAPSPLAPVLRGEGLGVRGLWHFQEPLTPNPSPRSTGARGTDAPLIREVAPQGNAPVAATLAEARQLADAGRLDEALAACQTLLAGSQSADLFSLLGILHRARRDDVQAAACLEKALYLAPDHPEALLHLMLLRQAQGDVAREALLRRRLERAGAGGQE